MPGSTKHRTSHGKRLDRRDRESSGRRQSSSPGGETPAERRERLDRVRREAKRLD
jgi:hypothetical protein